MTIVVGYVPDPTGALALDQALQEAGWRGTSVTVVNVIGTAGYRSPTLAAEKELDAVEARVRALHDDSCVLHINLPEGERVSDVLLRVAEQRSAVLVVVGLKRRSSVAKVLLGSTAQSVLLASRCPVLAVRAG